MDEDISFPDFYFTTHFRGQPIPADVQAFAIITAYPTTGETWPQWVIDKADGEMRHELQEAGALLGRMTGYSPTSTHAEPGWAAALPLDAACDLGQEYRQTALYYVESGTIYLSYCDDRRGLVKVGPFRERFTPADP